MLKFIEQLKQTVSQRRQAERDGWQRLVATVADGGEVDPHEAAAVLEAAGRTPDELQAAAELLTKRRQWAATLKTEAKAEKAVAAARDRIRKAEADFKQQHEAHLQLMKELEADRGRANGMRHEVNAARKNLLDTLGPETKARVAELEQLRHDADSREEYQEAERLKGEIEAVKLEP